MVINWCGFNIVYMCPILKVIEEGAQKYRVLSLAEDRGMSQTFPPTTLRFVGSDVNSVCSSAPVPEGAIWEGEGEREEGQGGE